jgi:hypothetical protein
VVVLEHLGSQAVQQFSTYEPEPNEASVMIRLRSGNRDGYFSLTVYSPEHVEAGEAGPCPPEHGTKDADKWHCQTLENGTTVITSEVGQGFSDDNAHGMVVFGSAVTPENGTAMAMYESYDTRCRRGGPGRGAARRGLCCGHGWARWRWCAAACVVSRCPDRHPQRAGHRLVGASPGSSSASGMMHWNWKHQDELREAG